jgi:hypothetical protein
VDDQSSSNNVDSPSVLKIELHVPRRELERKFEIVFLAEKRSDVAEKVMQMKAKTYPVLLNRVSSTSERNEVCSSRSKVVPCGPPGIGAKI